MSDQIFVSFELTLRYTALSTLKLILKVKQNSVKTFNDNYNSENQRMSLIIQNLIL